MAPTPADVLVPRELKHYQKDETPILVTILTAWGEGLNFGALFVLILLVLCNIRKGVILHKLILLELALPLLETFTIYNADLTVQGWYSSSSAILLYTSYNIHNLVAWLKIRPFLPRWGANIFIATLIAVQPYWIAEIVGHYYFTNGLGSEFWLKIRPWEFLLRDPWWVFTIVRLIWIIKTGYGYTLNSLIRVSPRFGIMLVCMLFSVLTSIMDFAQNFGVILIPGAMVPFWRFSLLLKCSADTIFIDDFKKVMDCIVEYANGRFPGSGRSGGGGNKSKLSSATDDNGGAANYDSSGRSRRGSKLFNATTHWHEKSTPHTHVETKVTTNNDHDAEEEAAHQPRDKNTSDIHVHSETIVSRSNGADKAKNGVPQISVSRDSTSSEKSKSDNEEDSSSSSPPRDGMFNFNRESQNLRARERGDVHGWV